MLKRRRKKGTLSLKPGYVKLRAGISPNRQRNLTSLARRSKVYYLTQERPTRSGQENKPGMPDPEGKGKITLPNEVGEKARLLKGVSVLLCENQKHRGLPEKKAHHTAMEEVPSQLPLPWRPQAPVPRSKIKSRETAKGGNEELKPPSIPPRTILMRLPNLISGATRKKLNQGKRLRGFGSRRKKAEKFRTKKCYSRPGGSGKTLSHPGDERLKGRGSRGAKNLKRTGGDNTTTFSPLGEMSKED